MQASPSRWVIEWLNRQVSSLVYVSTVTIGEIEYGLRVLPHGSRRTILREKFERFIAEAFAHRVLDFDERAARIYGEVMGRRRELGRPLSVPDGQIASAATSRGYAVATRNVRDFEDCGIEIIDPFLSS